MSLAKEADAHLTVMHVIAIPPELVSPPTADDFDVDRVRAAATAEYLRKLRELIPEAARTYSTVDTVVADGSPGRQIVRIAGERGSDLIVMGARGRGAVDLLVFGSAAQHVVRYASCPVLVVHAPNGPKTRSSRGGPSVD
jgi:nucleotide-binding universal stress UspA family protein